MGSLNEIGPLGASPFDAVRRMDEEGEHWTGRTLMGLMEYSRWEDFATVIEKAKASLTLVHGESAAQDHFRQVPKMVAIGSGAKREVPDYRLTRFGAYLTAMAGDDTKPAVAHARVYFAVRTHEAETTPTANAALSRKDLALMVVAAEEEKEQLAKELEVGRPKIEYVDSFVHGTDDGCVLRVLANQLKVGEKELRDLLIEKKAVYRKLEGSRWSRTQGRHVAEYSWHAYATHKAWFTEQDQPEAPRLHNGQMRTTLYVTPVGKVKIRDLVQKQRDVA